MNLPSGTTNNNAFGGERGGTIELVDNGTTFFTNDVGDMLDLTRMNSGVVNDEDINAMIKKTAELLNQKPAENVEEEKKEKEVGQLTIKNGKVDTIENFDSFLNLSVSPLDSDVNQEGALILFGFFQFDDPNLRIDYVDFSEDSIPLMRPSPMEPAQPGHVQKLGHPLGLTETKCEMGQLLKSSATFTNCTFIFNTK